MTAVHDAMPVRPMLLPVAAIFVALGPLIGGVLVALALGIVMAIQQSTLASLPAILVATPMLAYGFGSVLALLIGLTVALSRRYGGRTTVATPLAATVLVYGSAALLNTLAGEGVTAAWLHAALPVSLASAKFMLLPMLLAAVACWQIGRKARLL
ncbi:MAG: hypothetical protein KIT85_06345 [Pseudolabrys sp.]|nr:hypothetical protein [Pseudolabrys sp.]